MILRFEDFSPNLKAAKASLIILHTYLSIFSGGCGCLQVGILRGYPAFPFVRSLALALRAVLEVPSSASLYDDALIHLSPSS